MKDCLQITCTNRAFPHEHGHSCDNNCEACYGRVAVLKNLPSKNVEREH